MIKCFIVNKDLLIWPKKIVETCIKWGLEPIIVDNASTYPPLLEWYDTEPCKIYRLTYNGGHKVVFESGILSAEVKDDYYIVTDPDLEIWTLPDDTVIKLKEGFSKYPHAHKVGLAIKIDDMPDEYPLKKQVLIWETPFWQNYLGDDFYGAPLDTTFALYHTSRTTAHTISGIRTGGKYTVRHLPFYLTPDTLDDEIAYYMTNCNKAVSTQARYLAPMVEQYMRNKNER